MTVNELKKIWDEFYGEDMAVEYPAFYKKIKKLEIEKIKENEILKNTPRKRGIKNHSKGAHIKNSSGFGSKI